MTECLCAQRLKEDVCPTTDEFNCFTGNLLQQRQMQLQLLQRVQQQLSSAYHAAADAAVAFAAAEALAGDTVEVKTKLGFHNFCLS